MKTFNKAAMVASALVIGLGLSACDSKKENAAEDQVQAVRESADASGDALENAGERMGGATGEAMEDIGKAIRESGEAKADKMEDQADKMDKTPG